MPWKALCHSSPQSLLEVTTKTRVTNHPDLPGTEDFFGAATRKVPGKLGQVGRLAVAFGMRRFRS